MNVSDLLVIVHMKVSYDFCLIPTSRAPQAYASSFFVTFVSQYWFYFPFLPYYQEWMLDQTWELI